MLLASLSLALLATTISGEHLFSKPGNGKPVGGFRSFANTTFDLRRPSPAPIRGGFISNKPDNDQLIHATIVNGTVEWSIPSAGLDPLRGEYLFGKPMNGKLVHDMRTFATVTFDWSAPSGWAEIPKCHEWRLRRSYFELHSREHTLQRIQQYDHRMMPGHLVYPIMIGANADKYGDFGYWAAAVHKVFDKETSRKIKPEDKLIEIHIISMETWGELWMWWNVFAQYGMDLCHGGNYFDRLLPTIRNESKHEGQFQELVRDYTDVTSEYCTTTHCRCPDRPEYPQVETLTLAYPTQEGLEQLQASPRLSHLKDQGEVLEEARKASDMQMLTFMSDCYANKRFRPLNNVSLFVRELGANQGIFYAPYI